MNKFDEQAERFLHDCEAKMSIEFLRHGPHFICEDGTFDIYLVGIKRGEKTLTLKYGQSPNPNELESTQRREYSASCVSPTAYEILAVLQKHEPAVDVLSFACDYEYEINNQEDYKRVAHMHKIATQEFRDVCRVFGDVLEQLREIS